MVKPADPDQAGPGTLVLLYAVSASFTEALTRNAAVTAGPRGGVCGGIRWKLSAESWFFSGPGRIVVSRGSMAEG